MKLYIVIFLFLFSTFVASAEDRFAQDSQGKVPPHTKALDTVDGFGGWLLCTSDSDWQSKWETSRNTVPHMGETKILRRGQHLGILFFFANPKLNAMGAADVTCDIDIVKPDGTSALRQTNSVCLQGKLSGPVTNIYLSSAMVHFIGDPGDPAGKWLVQVTLKDNIRHVSLALKKSFTLLDTNT